jgi:hypothetical protein
VVLLLVRSLSSPLPPDPSSPSLSSFPSPRDGGVELVACNEQAAGAVSLG